MVPSTVLAGAGRVSAWICLLLLAREVVSLCAVPGSRYFLLRCSLTAFPLFLVNWAVSSPRWFVGVLSVLDGTCRVPFLHSAVCLVECCQ